uniref:Secretogranin II n=1 Tax=Gasterosteus aculeatus TaxID=69293 RepID=G3N4U8_GASAC
LKSSSRCGATMPSLTETSASLPLLCFANFLLLLLSPSLRDHRLRGSESDSQRGDVPQTPDADMLKALEYVESVRQRAGADPLLAAGYGDDADKLRAMLRLASNPVQSNKSEELLQAVLSTLQQTEKASQPGGAYPRGQPKQHGVLPHKKLPLMCERGPFKRMNENVEEKYTPQNLATLQSVFDELDKMSGVKTTQRRQDAADNGEEEDDADEDDTFDVRNVGYDDGDLAEWGPLPTDTRTTEGAGESLLVKRSSGPDDVANLVDYYLLRVLEKSEEEEHKRQVEEEERKMAERRAAQTRHSDTVDPRAVYQLIQISQKYQIPPEDLVDMLRTGQTTNALRKSGGFSRAENRLSQTSPKKTHKTPQAKLHSRRFPERQETPEDRRTEQILDILGFGGAEERAPVRKQKQSRLPALSAGRPRASAPAQRRPPPGDYDDTVDEDELAAYLAAQMLARYPKHRAYFDQMDSDRSPNERSWSEGEGEGRGGVTEMQRFDNEAVMKLLSSLNPETEESD